MASLLSLALRNAVEKENDKEGKEQDGVARFPLDEICDFFFLPVARGKRKFDRQAAIDSAGLGCNHTTRSLPGTG